MTQADGDPKQRLDSTLSKGLLVLEHLTQVKGSSGVSELSRKLGLTKSNTFRLLQTLTALGFVRREDDKTYSATLRTWQMGRAVVENLNLREFAAPMMRYLSEETGETVYLAVRDGRQVIYIDKIDSEKPIRSWNPIGGAAPLFCVGTGKAILAVEYADLRAQVAPRLRAYTDKTLTDLGALDQDMEATRLRGYAVDRGEFRPGIYSFGAAIKIADGSTVGAFGISMPSVNLAEGDAERMGGLVRHAADAVSQAISRL